MLSTRWCPGIHAGAEWGNVLRQVVLVVAQSLGMSQGKIAAQCAHAILGLYRRLQHNRTPWMQAWEVGKNLPHVALHFLDRQPV